MKPTLFILAAGMGSRYGGLKQIDTLGPSGETLMDYSVYDAIQAGFGKLVFVIRKDFEKDFRRIICSKYEHMLPVEVVFQELDHLPEGFSCPAERSKPWGTNHAVLMGKDVIKEPFAVINADDFYGRDAFRVMAEELRRMEGKENQYCMVGYRVGNTLSDSGTVARGICHTDAEGYLTEIVERTDIERRDGKIVFTGDDGLPQSCTADTPVSMNFWGFTPDYFRHSERSFKAFLEEYIDVPKSEFFIPLVVNQLIQSGTARCKVLDCQAKWFGVTYAQDRPEVVQKLQELVNKGEYPENLFKA